MMSIETDANSIGGQTPTVRHSLRHAAEIACLRYTAPRMKPQIRCVCGNAIDCDRLEMVVELRCPVCERALTLEFQGPENSRRWAMLTVIEGPHQLGSTFVLPVNEDLILGSENGSWLLLPEGEVAADHCRLRLDRHGVVTVANMGSAQGTWIGQLRVVQGTLQPGQELRLGFYCLRLHYEDVAGAVHAATPSAALGDVPEAVPLVVMKPVEGEETAETWLLRNRYVLARNALLTFGWLLGVFHYAHLRATTDWPPLFCGIAGVTVVAVLVNAWKRVALASPRWNIAAVVLTLTVAAADGVLKEPLAAVPALLLGGAAALMLIKEPRIEHVVGSLLLSLAGLVTVVVGTMQLFGMARVITETAPFLF